MTSEPLVWTTTDMDLPANRLLLCQVNVTIEFLLLISQKVLMKFCSSYSSNWRLINFCSSLCSSSLFTGTYKVEKQRLCVNIELFKSFVSRHFVKLYKKNLQLQDFLPVRGEAVNPLIFYFQDRLCCFFVKKCFSVPIIKCFQQWALSDINFTEIQIYRQFKYISNKQARGNDKKGKTQLIGTNKHQKEIPSSSG